MAYTPTEWKDHILSDNRYNISQNTDGTYNISPAGNVIQQGTKMSAENFNKLENGVFENSKLKNEVYNKTEIDTMLGDVESILASIVEI
ncbi:MAG: hypothetical protein IJA12_00625 [Oscillospiraceae bacterium]|nr:hypothetical protein [Oscillospiraceae bacterium]